MRGEGVNGGPYKVSSIPVLPQTNQSRNTLKAMPSSDIVGCGFTSKSGIEVNEEDNPVTEVEPSSAELLDPESITREAKLKEKLSLKPQPLVDRG